MLTVKYHIDDETVAHEKLELLKGHADDSGFDLYTPTKLTIKPGERVTLDLRTRFEIPRLPWILRIFGVGVEAHIRPKSGRSKAGLDAEFGTVDESYRGFVGVTLTNTTKKKMVFEGGEKICQIVFTPVFNRIKAVGISADEFSVDTTRSDKGFGSTGV